MLSNLGLLDVPTFSPVSLSRGPHRKRVGHLSLLKHVEWPSWQNNSINWVTRRSTMICQISGQKGETIDLHWRSLGNLVQLVKSLPQETWIGKQSTDGWTTIVELTRPLKYEDVELCKKRAGCIQRLGYEINFTKSRPSYILFYSDYKEFLKQEQVCELAPAVYDSLQVLGILPLPNLQEYLVSNEADFDTIHRVAGPNITSLEFGSLGYRSAFFRRDRTQIIPLPKSLRVLRFPDEDSPLLSEISTSFTHSFSEMSDLKILHLPHVRVLSKRDFRRVLLSATLRDLDLGSIPAEYLPLIPSESPQRLNHLQMEVGKLEDCYLILEKFGKCGTSELRSLKVNVWELGKKMPRTEDVENFFRAFRYLCDPKVLEVISFKFFWDLEGSIHPENNSHYAFTLQTISPLKIFTKIGELGIRYQPNNVHVFSDAFLEDHRILKCGN